MRVHVDFEHPFPDAPNVVCCLQGEPGTDYGDTFGVCVCNVTAEGFDANVGRQHPESLSWGQNLQLNYFAVYALNSSDPIQTGVVDVGAHDGEEQSKLITIEFPNAFPREPVVMCTVVYDDDTESLGCTLRNVTNTSAEVLVARTNPNATSWGVEARLAWVASDDWPAMVATVGDFDGGEDGQYKNTFEYDEGEMKKPPLLFAIAQHEDGSEYMDTMVATVAAVEKEGFQLNMSRVHLEERGWGQQMRCHVILVS